MAHLPAVKSKTTAERVVWMTRTSDVLGSHHQTDLDSYLTLIRRKIQEKCATTQELIYQIRRTKIGDGGHVTPNEFRFTLIAFSNSRMTCIFFSICVLSALLFIGCCLSRQVGISYIRSSSCITRCGVYYGSFELFPGQT